MDGTLTYHSPPVAWSWKTQLIPPWWGDCEIKISKGDLGWSKIARRCCGVIGGGADVSHLRTPCVVHIRLYCRCILLRIHRLSSRWIMPRSRRLRNRRVKLCIRLWSKEIRWHTIPSSWILSFWKSRCRSSLHNCRHSLGCRKDRSSWSRWRRGSGLWWRLTVTCFCLAILSWQSCCHRHLQWHILHLIWLYVTRTHATWKCAFCKSLDYCIVHRVAHDCCAFDKCLWHSLRHRIYHLVVTLRLRQWLEGRLNFLITSPDLVTLYDLRHSRLNLSKLLDYITRSSDAIRLEAFTFKSFHELKVLLLFDPPWACFHQKGCSCLHWLRIDHQYPPCWSFGSHQACQRCVDTKINTL